MPKKKNKSTGAQSKSEKMATSMRSSGRGEIKSDILGSYTGTAEKNEVPEQDADDL